MSKDMQEDVRKALGEEPKVEKTPTLDRPPNQMVANIVGEVDGKMQPLEEVGELKHSNKTPNKTPNRMNQPLSNISIPPCIFSYAANWQYSW